MSAFAQGFQMGGEMYDSSERIKLAKEQAEMAKKEFAQKEAGWKREEAIRTAGRETLGMAGKPVEYQGGEMGPQPEAAQTALRSDIATAPAKMYSEDQAQQDYLKRLRGIDVGKAQEYEKGALELSGLKRGERYAQRQENALGFQQNIMSELTNNGGDAAAVIEKHFIPLYNENKLPGLADGGTAKIVPSAVGGGKSILITDKSGKESTLPADLATLQKLTSHAQDLMMASSTPENYWKHKDQYIKERQVAATEKTAEASATQAATQAKKLDEEIRVGLFGAQAAQARGAANASNAHAAVYNNMVELAKTNKEAGAAVKEALAKYESLTEEEKAGPKGQQILTEGALAAAKKSGDITGIMNALKKPDRATVSAEMEKAAYQVYNDAVMSGDPKRIAAAKAAYPQVFGPSALDKAIAERAKKPETATAAPAAIPRLDKDELPRPAPGRALPQGSYVPNARTLLNTPKYGVLGTGTFNPND